MFCECGRGSTRTLAGVVTWRYTLHFRLLHHYSCRWYADESRLFASMWDSLNLRFRFMLWSHEGRSSSPSTRLERGISHKVRKHPDSRFGNPKSHPRFSIATQTILSRIPPNNSKLTYVWENYLFHYVSEGGFTFLVMADDSAGRSGRPRLTELSPPENLTWL